MPRRAALVMALVVGVAACSVRPTQPPIPASPRAVAPSPTATLAPATPAPTPTPTPAPTLPAGALERAWSVERDGVRLTVELERNPMPAGETTWLTSTVTNTGNDEMTWFHDGCAIPVGVWGQMDGVRWRDAPNVLGEGAREFQDSAIDRLGDDSPVVIDFMDEKYVGHKGTFGCPDIGISDPLPAGGSIVRRSAWDGFGYDLLGPPPTGLVPATATFHYYWRASEQPEGAGKTLELPFDVWIDSSGPAAVDPAEAVNLALMDPRLIEVIEARRGEGSTDQLVRYDPLTETWQVGLLDYTDPPRIHMVLVDANSGELVGWVERIWDYETDGFP